MNEPRWQRDIDHFIDGLVYVGFAFIGATWMWLGGWTAVGVLVSAMLAICAFYFVRSLLFAGDR